MSLRTTQSGANQGKKYWSCASCRAFAWKDRATVQVAAAGPPCNCEGAPLSVKRTAKQGARAGRAFWGCPNWSPQGAGCGFIQQVEEGCEQDTQARPRKAPRMELPPRPGFASHLSDYRTLSTIQRLLDVDPSSEEGLGVGRDVRDRSGCYDAFQVQCAWKIRNDEKERSYLAARANVSAGTHAPVELRSGHASASDDMPGDPLLTTANEVRLLHGTRPQALYDILFEGMKLEHAGQGLFGVGGYLCEHPGKADQYAIRDKHWIGPEFNGNGRELRKLHERLYEGVPHPRDVYYLLICKVILGRVDSTKDGRTSLADGHRVFTNGDRSALRPGFNSLMAERGAMINRYREFVIFNEDQILVEYLVAYHRIRKFCNCSPKKECTRRTVSKTGDNFGRPFIFCPDVDAADGCGFKTMLPTCACGRAAAVRISGSSSNSGRRYFGCTKNYDRCDFFQWVREDEATRHP